MHFDLGDLSEVATVAIVFGVPFLFAGIMIFLRHQQRMAREETLRRALEKGDKISPELWGAIQSRAGANRGTFGIAERGFYGCVLFGVGCVAELHRAGVLLLFAFIGLGFILRAYLAAREGSAPKSATQDTVVVKPDNDAKPL